MKGLPAVPDVNLDPMMRRGGGRGSRGGRRGLGSVRRRGGRISKSAAMSADHNHVNNRDQEQVNEKNERN